MIPEQLSGDHRELFKLLHKLHKLQVWNTELRTRSTSKGSSVLYEKDFVILSYQQYRSLCENIILLQKALLEDDKLRGPELLEKLHQSSSKEVENGTISRLEQLHSLLSGRLNDDTVQNGDDPENCGGSLLHLDIEQLEKVSDRKKSGVYCTRCNLSPYTIDSDSDCRTSKSTPGLKPTRQDSFLSLTHFHHLRTPVHSTANNRSKESTPTMMLPNSFDTDRRHCLSVLPLSPEALEEIAAGTKSISLVVATRRSKFASTESSFILQKENALPSLHVPETPRIILRPPVRKTMSTENLLAIAPRKDEDTKLLSSASAKKLHIQKSFCGNRSRSFEPKYSQMTHVNSDRSNRTSPHCGSPTKRTQIAKVGLNTKTYMRSKGKKSAPSNVPPETIMQVKSDQQAGEGSLQVLQVNWTPPSAIQQINAGQEKGQVLHKRVKGPREVTAGKSRSAFPGNFQRTNPSGKNPRTENRRK